MKLSIVRGLVIFLLLILAAPTSLQIASAQGPTPQTLHFPGYPAYEQFYGKIGQRFTFICLSQSKGGGYIEGSNLFGIDLYTLDSGLCAAAVQQGAITFENGGTVTIEIRPVAQSYKGGTRNGVTSRDSQPRADGSFVIISGAPVPTDTPAGPTAQAGPTAPVGSPCDWSGTWDRGGELFSFVQTLALPFGGTPQKGLTGTGISDPTWRMTGSVSGNVFTGKWSNSRDSGNLRITFSADCNSFDSEWGSGDSFTPFTGHGVRAGSAGPGSDGQPNTGVTNMTIQAARRRVIAGELVLVPVWLIKAGNVANLNFHLSYDANVVKSEGAATKGDLLDNALFSVNPNQSGSMLSGFAQTSGLAGTGTVLNIPFRAIGNPGDRTQLNVSVTTINDPGGAVLPIDKIAGEIVIYNKDGASRRQPVVASRRRLPC